MTANHLPCGCVMDTAGDTFIYQPCSPGCAYFQYAMQEGARQGKPIRAMLDPEITPATTACGCCAGATEGDVEDLCPGCMAALLVGDRTIHPHPLSLAQQALNDEDVTGPSLAEVIEQDLADWPDGHPCRDCDRLAKDHRPTDSNCRGWR